MAIGDSAGSSSGDPCRLAIARICAEFKDKLGFQQDSVSNQVEHVEALWKSFRSRHGGAHAPALGDLWAQLLRTQRAWRSKVWRPLLREGPAEHDEASPSEDEALKDICLFLLIWGELGNLRFCPELTCFLFTSARAFCEASSEARVKPEGSFLTEVVKPIFKVMLEETFQPGDPPRFKFGRAPAPAKACNYDDWNELFWDHERLGAALKLKGSGGSLISPATRPGDVWPGLAEVDWSRSLDGRKSHFEVHNALPLLVGCYRIFLLHSLAFGLLLIFSMEDERVPPGVRHALGLIVPFWMTVYELGYQVLTPAMAWQSRVKGILSMVFLYWTPAATFACAVLHINGWSFFDPMIIGGQTWNLDDLVLPFHALVSFVVLLLSLAPRSSNRGRWGFHPKTSGRQSWAPVPFWIAVTGVKLLFDYLVIQYCGESLLGIIDLHHMEVEKASWLFVPHLAVILLPAAICCFASMPFFLQLGIAIVGAASGIKTLGGLSSFRSRHGWGFQQLPEHLVRLVWQRGHGSSSSAALAGAAAGEGRLKPARTDPPRSLEVLDRTTFAAAFGGAAAGSEQVDPQRSEPADEVEQGLGAGRGRAGGAALAPLASDFGPEALEVARGASWWAKLSEREVQAFCDVWSSMLEDLRRRDLLSDREALELACQPPEAVPRLLDPSRAYNLSNALPPNPEARRRIVTLNRSLQNEMLPSGCVREMPALTVLVPHYGETILFGDRDLYVDGQVSDMLGLLLHYYQGELQNFSQRMRREREAARAGAGSLSGSIGSSQTDALRKWASLRMQTLWRTVDGVCHSYESALLSLLKHQDPDLSQALRNAVVHEKLQVVVAMQKYAKFSDPSSHDYDKDQVDAVEKMLEAFGGSSTWSGLLQGSSPTVGTLCIAYIEEQDSPQGKRYFSCLIDGTCPKRGGRRTPRFRIELPGYPILGHGKSDNQNCALIFSRGEVVQMIDANQEAYFEASLFLPLALQEFGSQRGGLRPGILGFREHIFSSVGLLGKVAADLEFAFGTVVQRTMDWPLDARLHYGHPDIMDKLQMLQQGGVSKATKGLNLSEDIFAGMDLTLRGGWTVYREYFHVGKGRDMGFMSVMAFYSKISMGNGEQAITRQWMRLGLHLPLQRFLGIFYTHIGFFLGQHLLNVVMKALAFMVAFFTLTDSEVHKGWSGPGVHMASQYFTVMYLFFVLATMMPLITEIGIEKGLRATCKNLGSSILRLNPIFAAFQSKLLGYYFINTVYYGGAQYTPTGRGLATSKESFVKLYRCFAASHMNDGFEAGLFLAFSYGIYYSNTFYACMAVATISWTIAPFLFNPRQFDSPCEMCQDMLAWVCWLSSGEGSEEDSWTSWCVRLQDSRRTASRRWVVLPSGRLFAAICTLALLLEANPLPAFEPTLEWVQSLWMLLPPLWHALFCLFLGMASSAGVEVPPGGSYGLMALVASLVTAAEVCLIVWNRASADKALLALLFHKYICTRFFLEVADNIAVHQPGGRAASFLHHGCRLWALSWRWLRDLLVGLVLASFCLILAVLPGTGMLHACFLFRTCKRTEAVAQERLLGLSQSASRSMSFSGHSRSMSFSGHSVDHRPEADSQMLDFIRSFTPQAPASNSVS